MNPRNLLILIAFVCVILFGFAVVRTFIAAVDSAIAAQRAALDTAINARAQ